MQQSYIIAKVYGKKKKVKMFHLIRIFYFFHHFFMENLTFLNINGKISTREYHKYLCHLNDNERTINTTC